MWIFIGLFLAHYLISYSGNKRRDIVSCEWEILCRYNLLLYFLQIKYSVELLGLLSCSAVALVVNTRAVKTAGLWVSHMFQPHRTVFGVGGNFMQ